MFELLESAQTSIHIQTYRLGGEVALKLIELLARNMREGIEVRLMFTATGFVISGGPSDIGTVSSLSHLRSYMFHDMDDRKRIFAALNTSEVKWADLAPIGWHWRCVSRKRQGSENADA